MKAAEMAVNIYRKIRDMAQDRERDLLFRELISRADELNQVADELEGLLGQAVPATLLRETIQHIRECMVQIKQMSEGIRHPFMLFVVGMGKFGKSTLINALIGARVADMDVLPKTWKIDVFTASRPEDRVLIKHRTGYEEEMSVEKARVLLHKEEEKFEASRSLINAHLKRQLPQLKTLEEKEEYKAYLRKRYLYRSPVSEVHWPVPQSRILRRFDIVDTPGLFQELLPDETKTNLRDYYHKADGVIWMLDATKISSQKPYELLQDLDTALEEIGGRTDNIIGVLNRIDLVGRDPATREKVLEAAHRIFEQRFSIIIPLSAKQALEAVENDDAAKLRESGLENLIDIIESYFLSRAVRLQKESKLTGFKSYMHQTVNLSAEYLARRTFDEEKRRVCEKKLRKDLETFEQEMGAQVKSRFMSYQQQVGDRIEHIDEKLFERSEAWKRIYLQTKVFDEAGLSRLEADLQQMIFLNAKLLCNEHIANSVFKEFPHLSHELMLPDLRNNGDATADGDILGNMDQDFTTLHLMGGIGAGILGNVLFGGLGFLLGVALWAGIGQWLVNKLMLDSLKFRLLKHVEETVEKGEEKYCQIILKLKEEIRERVSVIRETTFAELHGPPRYHSHVVEKLNSLREIAEKPIPRVSVVDIIKGGRAGA